MTENELRELAIKLLETKGYKVLSIARGQGVPKLSRIELRRDGKKETCALKVSTRGRISFTRNSDGRYKVLSEVDYVLHVTPDLHDPSKARVTLFDRETVLVAFEENFAALTARGMGHIPIWVNPEKEVGWRMTGSGFINRAIWSELISERGLEVTGKVVAAPDEQSEARGTIDSAEPGGVMDRIRAILSDHMGVRPELIDIEVRVRV